MAKSSQQVEQEFIADLPKQTGKSLENWMDIMKNSGLSGRNALLDWLKSHHGFGHVNASLLAGIHMNGGQPVYGNSSGLLADQFMKKEHLKPLYQTLMDRILSEIPEARVEIKKTYTSLNARREFVAIGIKANEIRVAMDLEGEPDGTTFSKMTGIGCMPRISHMVKIAGESQINSQLIEHVKTAYDRLN